MVKMNGLECLTCLHEIFFLPQALKYGKLFLDCDLFLRKPGEVTMSVAHSIHVSTHSVYKYQFCTARLHFGLLIMQVYMTLTLIAISS